MDPFGLAVGWTPPRPSARRCRHAISRWSCLGSGDRTARRERAPGSFDVDRTIRTWALWAGTPYRHRRCCYARMDSPAVGWGWTGKPQSGSPRRSSATRLPDGARLYANVPHRREDAAHRPRPRRARRTSSSSTRTNGLLVIEVKAGTPSRDAARPLVPGRPAAPAQPVQAGRGREARPRADDRGPAGLADGPGAPGRSRRRLPGCGPRDAATRAHAARPGHAAGARPRRGGARGRRRMPAGRSSGPTRTGWVTAPAADRSTRAQIALIDDLLAPTLAAPPPPPARRRGRPAIGCSRRRWRSGSCSTRTGHAARWRSSGRPGAARACWPSRRPGGSRRRAGGRCSCASTSRWRPRSSASSTPRASRPTAAPP